MNLRKIFVWLGIIFLLLPIAALSLFMLGGMIYDTLQERKHDAFNQHLKTIFQTRQRLDANELSLLLKDYIDSDWSEVCVFEVYCGTSDCSPYTWEIIFKGSQNHNVWPLNNEIFGTFYSHEELIKIPCIEKADANFIFDHLGLRVEKKQN